MLFMRFMKGEVMGWYSIPLYFVQLAFGGMAIGWVVGKVMNFLLKHTTNATSEIMITITCAYSTFILAEACGTSGVLAVVLLGFTMAKGGQAYVTNREALEVFWEETELLANTMIFAISGVIMTTNIDLGSMFRDYKVEEGTVPNDLHGGDVVFLIVRRNPYGLPQFGQPRVLLVSDSFLFSTSLEPLPR
jgi:NhaP-type Na+/H+ or K+/H+ antiporter